MDEQKSCKVVGIIGAGAAGLCAARHVQTMEGWKPLVWEQSLKLGGTWRLSSHTSVNGMDLKVHSSLYNTLRTDLPAAMMAFPDFSFPEGESFMHHTTVLKYLEDYAHHFNLFPHIKFGQCVEKVSPMRLLDEEVAWEITVRDLATGQAHSTTCQSLLVCNGHFSEPSIPEIKGIEKYEGRKLHSHNYREPSAFVNSNVVVLGAAASGLDISLELSSVADKVFLCHKLPIPIPSEFPSNLHQMESVYAADEEGFTLSDGKYVKADAILYCTGYKYTFPFLMDDCGITVNDNHVRDLYKHIINIKYPTMGFIGLPSRVVVFPLINYQVQYFLATLKGVTKLPAFEEMMATVQKIDQERKNQGLPEKHCHTLASVQFEYLKDLAKEACLEEPPPFMSQMLMIVLIRLFFSYPIFKSYQYEISNDGTIIEDFRGERVSTWRDLAKLVLIQTARCLWRDFPKVFKFLYSSLMKKVRGYLRF